MRKRERKRKEGGEENVLSECGDGTDDKGCLLSDFVILGVILRRKSEKRR